MWPTSSLLSLLAFPPLPPSIGRRLTKCLPRSTRRGAMCVELGVCRKVVRRGGGKDADAAWVVGGVLLGVGKGKGWVHGR